jgi:hypothetical protein
MFYTRPASNAADLSFDGTAYTRPSSGSADVTFLPDTDSGTGAVTLDFTIVASGAHGVAGTGALTLDIVPDAAGTHDDSTRIGDGAVTLDFVADAAGAHGVTGTGAVTLTLAADASAGHGVAGPEDCVFDFSVSAVGAHGVAGDGAVTFTLTPACVAVHERYEVRGEVRVSGVLVNRQVRAHRRDTGEMVGEAATVAGVFHVPTGLVAREHYVVPINLDSGATDWSPPTANRVVSVLAQDV